MQVAAISSSAALSQLLTAVTPVNTVTTGAGGVVDPEQAMRIREQQQTAKAHKVAEAEGQRVETPASQAQTAAPQQHAAPSHGANADNLAPVTEGQLFDYLDKAKSSHDALKPSALLESAAGSFVDLVEKAQETMSKQLPDAQKAEVPASEGSAEAQDTSANPANMDDVLDRYVSVSWAMFSASLATNSVAAASSSVNTLVKQQ